MKRIIIGNFLAAFCLLFIFAHAGAQNLTGSALIDALRQGGYVLVMRHTSSPRALPDAATVNADNTNGERQLDEKGRRDAAATGEALRRLQIPVNEVLSSPAYRALETARIAGLTDAAVQQELGNDGMEQASAQNAAWLREQVTQAPQTGNRLLITHGPNISSAFAEDAQDMEEGDMLVFDPADGHPMVIAKISSADWVGL